MPGSGNLELERVAEVFGWCVECGQFVGRACCWGREQTCVRCGEARRAAVADGANGAFAALAAARAAVRQLDGVTGEFSAIDAALDATRGVEGAAAVGAWEDAWLAAGALKARLDASQLSAISLVRALPPGETERTLELEDELEAIALSHATHWHRITAGIVDTGKGLRTRLADEGSERSHTPASAAPESAPIPTAARAVPVALPMLPPERVTIAVAADAVAAPVAPVAPVARRASPMTPPAMPLNPRVVTTQPSHRRPGPRMAPEPPTAAVAGPFTARNGGSRRRGAAIAAWIVIVVLALAGGILVGSADRDLLAGAAGDADATAASRSTSAPASVPGSRSSTADASPLLVTVEVAFPTSFDRSLRLTGPDAGVCLEVPAQPATGPSSLAFDLHLGEAGAGGELIFGLAPTDRAPAISLILELKALEVLDRDAWYRLVVTGERSTGRVAVTTLDDGQTVLEAELAVELTGVPASSGQACLRSSLPSSEASLLVDNLRVGR